MCVLACARVHVPCEPWGGWRRSKSAASWQRIRFGVLLTCVHRGARPPPWQFYFAVLLFGASSRVGAVLLCAVLRALSSCVSECFAAVSLCAVLLCHSPLTRLCFARCCRARRTASLAARWVIWWRGICSPVERDRLCVCMLYWAQGPASLKSVKSCKGCSFKTVAKMVVKVAVAAGSACPLPLESSSCHHFAPAC